MQPSWNRRRTTLLLGVLLLLLLTAALAFRSVSRRGVVRNDSTHMLWVVDTDTGVAVAHLLAPGRRSPRTLDADGVRSADKVPIDEHSSWWKARDVSVAVIHDQDGSLSLSCIACSAVHEDEFGPVRYDRTPGWGEPTRD